MSSVQQQSESDKRRAVFRAYLGAQEMSTIVNNSSGRLLDIGGAFGIHTRYFRERCKNLTVDVMDIKAGVEPLVYEGSYFDYKPSIAYDYLWCSHVVEHLRNPGQFFDKAFEDLKEGGWIGVTVPPLKSDMTFQHVTLWNAGLLLIHLIHAGFDCSNAHVATYGYNVTVIAQKQSRGIKPMPQCLPEVERKGIYFLGDISRLNWHNDDVKVLRSYSKCIDDMAIPTEDKSHFYYAFDNKKRKRMFYYDASAKAVYLAG